MGIGSVMQLEFVRNLFNSPLAMQSCLSRTGSEYEQKSFILFWILGREAAGIFVLTGVTPYSARNFLNRKNEQNVRIWRIRYGYTIRGSLPTPTEIFGKISIVEANKHSGGDAQ